MLTGLNHITIAVSDLEVSFQFYVSLLGFKPVVKWDAGAYLSLGDLWLCLAVDAIQSGLGKVQPAQDYSHIAFAISAQDFLQFSDRLLASGVQQWKQNTSEGDSLYVFDPDGHKLEIHVGNLESRLASLRLKPYSGVEFY